MAVTTFRGEKNLGELADKLFTRLTPRQREKVEDALLKANPQLDQITELRSGTLLKVPDLPELRAKAKRAGDGPDDQLAAHLDAELAAFGKHLTQRFAAAQEAVAKTESVLNEAELKRVITKEQPLRDLAKQIGTLNAERKKQLEERQQKFAAALKQMQGELQKA
ncbi:hypothetical protein [Aquipseudomonas alcaligenes]|uniref:hypothetical protein n=1 Tax=Aquipseudomonas alcaligenes TaxID=43263 RepID=UPI001F225849|nr:hypothetical protein [Pseudomonas alcaligenes]